MPNIQLPNNPECTETILIVLGKAESPAQNSGILRNLLFGLCAWTGVPDGEELLSTLEEAIYAIENVGFVTVRHTYSGEHVLWVTVRSFDVCIIINPGHELLKDAVQSFMSSPAKYGLLVYSGLVMSHTGAWLIKDQVLTAQQFCRLLPCERDVTRHRDLWTPLEGDWTNRLESAGISLCAIDPPTPPNCPLLLQYCVQYMGFESLLVRLKRTDIFGDVSSHQPTLIIFPAGEGGCCYLSIANYDLLVDGGMSSCCFWPLVNFFYELDCLLLTNAGPGAVRGVETFLRRLGQDPVRVNPRLLSVVFNCPSGEIQPQKVEQTPWFDVEVSPVAMATKVVEHLKQQRVRPIAGVRARDKSLKPIILFQKLGIGVLELYVLHPTVDSKELRDVNTAWKEGAKAWRKEKGIPITSLASMVALLIWRPAHIPGNESFKTKETRLLFPGTVPQTALMAALASMRSIPGMQRDITLSQEIEYIPLDYSPVKNHAQKQTLEPEIPVVSFISHGNSQSNGDVPKEGTPYCLVPKESSHAVNSSGSAVAAASDVPSAASVSSQSTASVRGSSTRGRGKLNTRKPVALNRSTRPTHVYLEVAYIPNHGETITSDFFANIRARFYVLSTVSVEVSLLNAMLEGKKQWPSICTSLLPTHFSDSMMLWHSKNYEAIKSLNITLSPPAEATSVQLDDINFKAFKIKL